MSESKLFLHALLFAIGIACLVYVVFIAEDIFSFYALVGWSVGILTIAGTLFSVSEHSTGKQKKFFKAIAEFLMWFWR